MSNIVPGLVSTIIPVYNRKEMVATAVQSVLDQEYRPIEIILVNDGSTDDTGIYLDQLAAQYPNEVVAIHRENGGAGLARESGRQSAKGQYIQYLDSDDWLLPNKFTDQVNALSENPDCDIAYGISRMVDVNGVVMREPSKWTGKKIEYLFPSLLIDRWWHTHTPLYSRKISDLAGAWPRRRPEDWDLEARMGARHPKLVHCGSLVSCHLDHSHPDRVSYGDQNNYLKDEAWFLPRLYDCAIQAGITNEFAEMNHFARWAFMRARQLGALGESKRADSLLELARTAGLSDSMQVRIIKRSANLIGWKMTGILCRWIEPFMNHNKHG